MSENSAQDSEEKSDNEKGETTASSASNEETPVNSSTENSGADSGGCEGNESEASGVCLCDDDDGGSGGAGPFLIAVVAILISISTLFATLSNDPGANTAIMDKKLHALEEKLEAKLVHIDKRVNEAELALLGDRESRVKAELSRALAAIQGVSPLAEGEAKLGIGKIEQEISALLNGSGHNGGKAHWGYSGKEGPKNWGNLSSQYATCSSGNNQSPINLTGMVAADLQEIQFSYDKAPGQVLNNGHTVQVNFPIGNSITVGGHTYNLLQVHFHTPSENNINGQSFPMEGHFVHADADGKLAVVAVMFTEGAENTFIGNIWNNMATHKGEVHIFHEAPGKAPSILPSNRDYYQFTGSLTTPPCSEGVRWMVLKSPVELSKSQIDKFKHTMHHDNNRPLQPINARTVLM